MFRSPSAGVAMIFPFKSRPVLIGEPVDTIRPPSGAAGLYIDAGAIQTNGTPFARAVTIDTILDFPMSREPPATAAATAEPLVARVS